MENVSVALRMAAGILIGILLTSLVVYMHSNIKEYEEERVKSEKIKEVTDFNKKFNAYEKSSMYGTDIMSVMGLAYNANIYANAKNNLKPDGSYDPDAEGSVNITIILKKDIIGKKEQYIYVLKDGTETLKEKKTLETKEVFKAGTYSLQSSETNLKKIKDIIIEGNQKIITDPGYYKPYDSNYNGRPRIETITSLTGFSEFKARIFKNVTEKTKYDVDGRIKEMTFEEIEI